MYNTLYNLFRFNYSYLAICLLCLSLGVVNPAQAEYKKPKTQGSNDAPSSQSTGIAATRSGSCSLGDNKTEDDSAAFATLAPYEHIGQSTATNPTFTWYINDRESYPVEFGLYEFDAAKYKGIGKQIYQTSLSSSAGIMTHSLPTEVSLVSDKTYVWQVALICNPNSPSQSLVANNLVEIVEIDPAIASQIDQAENSATKANIYAQSALWYDALAEVVTLPEDPQAKDAAINLIEQLATIEPDRSNLRQIVDSLQPE